MDDVPRLQLAAASDRCLADAYRTVRRAFVLDGRTAAALDRARDTGAEDEVVVRRVDYRVDVLLRDIADHDHDASGRHAITSSTRASSMARVARAIPRRPTFSIVSDAQATPHASDSRSADGLRPAKSQCASIPAATASPAPVVSTIGC